MPAYSTPGVYVNESQLQNLTPALSGGTAAVFFGEAARGPVEATLVTDWPSYRRLYGELNNDYDLGYAVYHFFANGGRNAYVVRVAASAAVAASSSTGVQYNPDGQGDSKMFDVDAKNVGAWGNDLTVQIEALSTEGGAATSGLAETADGVHGTFTVVVKLDGTEVERWPAVSLDPAANRYVSTIINTYSEYVEVSNVSTADADASRTYTVTAYAFTTGADGTLADTDYVSAIDAIDLVKGNLLLNAVGRDGSTVINGLLSKASERGDSFVLIDPSLTAADVATTKSEASTFASASNGGYGAIYAPALKMVDPAKTGPGAVRDTYPCGAVAGVIARTENQRTVAKAPAGYAADVRGALGTVYRLSDDDIGSLYDYNPYINSFKTIPGAGVVVYGSRTLATTTADKFIPVRRTLNYVKSSLKDITSFAVFEPNNELLWERLTARVGGFLGNFYRLGGLKGQTSREAFYVICNSSNNNTSSIDQGIVNIEVGIALQYPAEFIVINLAQWSGGSNTVESL